MKQITAEEWKYLKYHHYASIINGQRHILENDPKLGTVLTPVTVIFPPRQKKAAK